MIAIIPPELLLPDRVAWILALAFFAALSGIVRKNASGILYLFYRFFIRDAK
ncbi:MAG: hypothetical protein J0M10_11750 [Chitinophagales bacterium]|nr:hypothetical protein [Chitinophagales bacterium]